jgi:hypothetical protein
MNLLIAEQLSACQQGLSSKPLIETDGFEVLTAVAMKSTIVPEVTPRIAIKVHRRFGDI